MNCDLQESRVFFYEFAENDSLNEAEYIPQSKWEEFSDAAKLAMLFAAGNPPVYGKRNYFDLYSRIRCIYSNHPFREKTQGTVSFMGANGISASIGPWLQYLTTHQEEISEINIFECEVEPGQHQIYMEYTDIYNDSYLVSGMTDYSGEGGNAFRLASKIVRFVSFVTKCQMNVYYVKGDWDEKFQLWLSETVAEEYTV